MSMFPAEICMHVEQRNRLTLNDLGCMYKALWYCMQYRLGTKKGRTFHLLYVEA